jgi:hypothetical protein
MAYHFGVCVALIAHFSYAVMARLRLLAFAWAQSFFARRTDVLVDQRKRLNFKRTLNTSKTLYLPDLASKVRYGGNPEHKRNPGDFGLQPPSCPRPDKSLCDGIGVVRETMMNGFHIGFEWLQRDGGFPEEKAAFAELFFSAQKHNLLEAEDLLAKTVRRSIRVSAYHVACWLASNWWRLRWEPERETPDWHMSHQLGAAGGGRGRF